MISYPLTTLDDPLYQAEFWETCDATHFTAGYKPEGLPLVTYKVSRKDLERYHPDLALAFAMMLAWRADRGHIHFSKGEAMDTMRLLLQGGPTFIDLGTTPCLLTAMNYMKVSADPSKAVELYGDVTNVESMTVKGRAIYFAGDTARRRIFVERSELAARHPDWENRYTVASELGFTGHALMNHVFYPQVEPIANIEGLAFE